MAKHGHTGEWGLRFGGNFEVNFGWAEWEAYIALWILVKNIAFALGPWENDGKPWSIWPVAGPYEFEDWILSALYLKIHCVLSRERGVFLFEKPVSNVCPSSVLEGIKRYDVVMSSSGVMLLWDFVRIYDLIDSFPEITH